MSNPLSLPLADLPDPLPIPTLPRPFTATIRPPGSKSLTNRALLLAALADGTSTLHNPLTDADDAQRMLDALTQLGCSISNPYTTSLSITGVAGTWRTDPARPTRLNLNNAGTATRFLTAATLLAAPSSSITIDGNARMRQRPIAELADALTQLNVNITYDITPNYPPITLTPPSPQPRAAPDRTVRLPTTASSQFLSALLLTAPFLPGSLSIHADEPVTSRSYVEMTVALLRSLAVPVECQRSPDHTLWRIDHHPLPAFTLDIEPDASGATYFLAAAALVPGSTITIESLDPSTSLQRDADFANVLVSMGALTRNQDNSYTSTGTINPYLGSMDQMPDAAMTLAALCTKATAPSQIWGLRTLRVKETDRLEALKTELTKLGATIDIISRDDPASPGKPDEGLAITPINTPPNTPVLIDTYDDHRIAMALATLALAIPNIHINNPKCVAKTYPTFFQDLARLYH